MDRHELGAVTAALGNFTPSAGTTSTITLTAAPSPATFCIKGRSYTKATAANVVTAGTTDIVTGAAFQPIPPGYGGIFTIGLDSGGNMKIAQGSIEAGGGHTDGSNAAWTFVNALRLTAQPDTICPVAYLIVKVGSAGAAWTLGASNTSGVANTGYAWQAIATLPDRPLVA